jgi:hypothetical protein
LRVETIGVGLAEGKQEKDMPTPSTSIRLGHDDVELFHRVQQQLQEMTPHATVTLRHTFRLAMETAIAALAAHSQPTTTRRRRRATADCQPR